MNNLHMVQQIYCTCEIFLQKMDTFLLRLSISHFLVDGRYLSHILLDLQNLYYVVSSGSVATCIIIFMKHT